MSAVFSQKIQWKECPYQDCIPITLMKKMKYIGIHFTINNLFPEALTHGKKKCLQTGNFFPIKNDCFLQISA